MKDNISMLGKDFQGELSLCKQEEDTVRSIQKELETAYSDLQKHNQTRIAIINEIRLKKVEEINIEIEETKQIIKELRKEYNQLLHNYCKKHKHHYVLIQKKYIGQRYSYQHYCFSTVYNYEYKCTVCGCTHVFSGRPYSKTNETTYKQAIPQEAYEDATLSLSGRTLRVIEREITTQYNYLEYLDFLKHMLCEIFGHDAKLTSYDNETFECKCCGEKHIPCQEYIDMHYKAILPGIVPYYYSTNPDKNYITKQNTDIIEPLPTYEQYQRIRKKVTTQP